MSGSESSVKARRRESDVSAASRMRADSLGEMDETVRSRGEMTKRGGVRTVERPKNEKRERERGKLGHSKVTLRGAGNKDKPPSTHSSRRRYRSSDGFPSKRWTPRKERTIPSPARQTAGQRRKFDDSEGGDDGGSGDATGSETSMKASRGEWD